jgi:mono/diheme cytochrome c family protein
MTTRRRALAAASILAIGLAVTACGSQGIEQKVADGPPDVARGANLFAQRCAGCHTMDVVGAQGGATLVTDRERVDGPNFNVRKETKDSVLYAIRNGGFSGAIMPENIVVGQDANDVAAFLSKYAGQQSKTSPTPTPPATQPPSQQQQETTSTEQQTTPEAGTTSTPAGGGQQANAQGKQVFTENCASCHTLKDAAAKGQVGPNLDDLKPDDATVQRQVTNGGGGMPAFKGQLSAAEIKAVAQYVSSVAGQ